MKQMIAFCGLICSDCPAFLATINDDNAAREKTAELFSKRYNINLRTEDVNCDGCLKEGGRLLAYCSSCEIRKCSSEKGLGNCAGCKEQQCGRLKKVHDYSPDAKNLYEKLLHAVKG